jgi:DNA-directed RNA polymerase subunit RPC12/RpoP
MQNRVEYIEFETYRDEDGKIDWKALDAAREQNGERCTECGSGVLFPTGSPSKCGDCDEFSTDDGEVTHSSRVRCPSCNYSIDLRDDFYELYEEGEHEIYCLRCDYEFTVSTMVSYTFTSPPRVEKEEPDAE